MYSSIWATYCCGSGSSLHPHVEGPRVGRSTPPPPNNRAFGDCGHPVLPVLQDDWHRSQLQRHRFVVTRREGGCSGSDRVRPALDLGAPLGRPLLRDLGPLAPRAHHQQGAGVEKPGVVRNVTCFFFGLSRALALSVWLSLALAAAWRRLERLPVGD